MSKVTDIKNYLDTLVGGALPATYFELPDNLVIEDNSNLYLEKGYAVSFGPAENDTQNLSRRASYNKTI